MAGAGAPPTRRLKVAFLGAGASKAGGLPLTEELLDNIYPRSGPSVWHSVRSRAVWQRVLSQAIEVLYPSGGADGYRPNVADFFTILEVVGTVHSGRERLPLDAVTLVRELRLEIARGIHDQMQGLTITETPHYRWMAADGHPQVVVTSNWDTLIERAAMEAGRTVRFDWPRDTADRRMNSLRRNEVVILKLHGSIDWGTYGTRTELGTPMANLYADLKTPVYGYTAFGRAPKPSDKPLRFGSLEDLEDSAGSGVGFNPPLMATMAVGKHAQIDVLGPVWDDAYWALSRARSLAVIGYSFPPDDLELRTLLRVATRRAGRAGLDPGVAVSIFNPAPEAHERGRSFLGDPIRSNFNGAGHWAP